MIFQGKAILVLPDKLPERTASGRLMIPKTINPDSKEWGLILEHGPQCENAYKGARVLFASKPASHISIDDRDMYIVDESRTFYIE
jgi:hypothetical protein